MADFNLTEMADEFHRLSDLLDAGLKAMRVQAQEMAEAEQEYRKLKSEAWIAAPEGTVPQREAWVQGRTADARYRRDLAVGMSRAAYQAVQSRQTQISSLQSLLAAHREEAAFARTGPQVAA